MTKSELESKIKECFSDAEDIKLSYFDGEKTRIKLVMSAMYEAPGRSLRSLLKLAEFIGSNNIEEEGTSSLPGCDTCDFGSKYEVILSFPVPVNFEWK